MLDSESTQPSSCLFLDGCLLSPLTASCFISLKRSWFKPPTNGRATVEERLPRWLLMGHDRTEGDEIPLTHEFLALMLGVRRAGVTVSLGLLEKKALVSTKRGTIIIDDRRGLEVLAGGFYGVPEAESLRLTSWHAKNDAGVTALGLTNISV